ncbi:MAG: hypothetical protein JXR60_00110 [Bacteroidales bacterium]|nr:hypothetical protein [Bacteroidales bacterium]
MRIIYLILLIFLLLKGSAQDREYFRTGLEIEHDYFTRFENYATEDGLSDNQVTDILQDHFGYMWFATPNGLNKFDGYEFEVFYNNPKDSASISDNHITAIEEDIYGNLWIGTKNGLNKYNRKSNNFIHYTTNNILKDNFVKALLADTSGNIWVDTYSGYLHKINVKNLEVNVYKHTESLNEIYLQHQLWLDQDKLWVLHSGYTCYLELGKEKFIYIKDIKFNKTVNDNIDNSYVNNTLSGYTSGIKDSKGNYYFGNSNGKGVYYSPSEIIIDKLGLGSVYIMRKQNDDIWLGGYGRGLGKYNIKNNRLTFYINNQDNNYSLAHNRVWDIYIDKNENIWIGTGKGISKLNIQNNQFKHIKHIANIDNTIISNDVKDIIQTKDSNIWIASYGGLDCYNSVNHSFKHFVSDKKDKASLLSDRVNALFEDSYGDLWVGFWAGLGFDKYLPKTNTFEHFSYNKTGNLGGSDWYIGFAESKNKDFYTANWGYTTVAKFDRLKKEYTKYHFAPYAFHQNSNVYRLAYYNNNFWWDFYFFSLKTNEYSMYLKSSQREEYLIMPYNLFLSENYFIDIKYDEELNKLEILNKDLYHLTIFGILKYSKQQKKPLRINKEKINATAIENTWHNKLKFVGTPNGLLLFNEETGYIEHSYTDSLIYRQHILSLLKDNNKLWVGTETGLINLEFKTSIQYNISTIDTPLCKEKITDIAKQNNKLWLATENGLICYTQSNKKVLYYNEENSMIASNVILDLHLDKNNNLWVGTKAGLCLYNGEKNSFEIFKHDPYKPNTIPNNSIFSMSSNQSDSLFIGTEKGFCMIDINTHKITLFDEASNKSVQSSLLSCVYTDSKGFIWTGNADIGNSLDRINPINQTVEHFIDRAYDSTSYKGTTANFIYEDSKGIIWAGSNKGLNRFNEKEKNFKLFDVENGFPENNVLSMLEDNNGDYWITTSKSLFKWNPELGVTKIYTHKDYHFIGNYKNDAAWKTFTGELYFGGMNGITSFHPDSIYNIAVQPNLAFTKIYINDSLFKSDLSLYKEIDIQYFQNNFTIYFSNFDFLNSKNVEYAYKLEGFDNRWIETTAKHREAKYTNLPYGSYKLKLKSTNNLGLWDNNYIVLNINIIAPWWRTNLAYAFFGFLIFMLVFAYIKWRVYQLKIRQKELENLVEERTNEVLEQQEALSKQATSDLIKKYQLESINEKLHGQEEERNRLAQELHDGNGGSLTGIKLYIENIISSSKTKELNILLNNIDKLYSDVRSISHDLRPPEFLNSSIKDVSLAYISELKNRTRLDISCLFFPKEGWDKLDEDLQIELYRILQELLNNILKHAKATEIDVQFIQHEDYINITVEDNGLGFDIGKKKAGIGLKNIKDRLLRRNGKLNIDTKAQRGTVISIEIPIIK